MLIPSAAFAVGANATSLSRRVNANSQRTTTSKSFDSKLIKKGEC